MDEYFLTKKAVEIILENINDHFIKCLVSLSIHERYADDTKVIIGIIELLKTYMETRRNDILSSCIKYTNKSYYLQLSDNLFRLIQSHLTITKRFVFLFDLIDKYNYPVIATTTRITRNYKDDNVKTRFTTDEGDVDTDYNADTDDKTNLSLLSSRSKDAGTLFKDAYYKLKKTKMADIELQMMETKNNNRSDLL